MEDNTYTYMLIGGARDGEEGEHDMGDEGGIVDNMVFAHPQIGTLCIHYRLESLIPADDGNLEAVEYIFVKEFNTADFDEYAEHHLKPLEADLDG